MGTSLLVHEADDNAEWRSNRFTTNQFLERQILCGRGISPIFSVFGVFIYLFRVDWLHAADLGVAADFLGNLFHMLLPKMAGNTRDQRVQCLWEHMQKFYADNPHVLDRMDNFLYKHIDSGSSTLPPKLKANGACTRALVPFGNQMARMFLSDAIPIEQAAKAAAHHLLQCYQSLSHTSAGLKADVMYESSKQFANHYYAIFRATGDGVAWRVKPKMHCFLEVCSEGTDPNLFWCYRDEDCGGTVAKQCKMRGNWNQYKSFSRHGLSMFCIQNDPPRLVTAS